MALSEAPREVDGAGSLLRRLRQERGWTLAQAAQVAGIGRVTLTRWETGAQHPRLAELEALLEALGTGPREKHLLLTRMDTPRARMRARAVLERAGERAEIGPLPHGGDLLRALRLRRGLALEAAAHHLGVAPRTLRRWESGEVRPPAGMLAVLGGLLNASDTESAALASDRFVGGGDVTPPPLDVLEERWTRHREVPVHAPGFELGWLSLEAHLWPWALRCGQGRRLLAAAYSDHADHLVSVDRWSEARRYAARALEVHPLDEKPGKSWIIAGLAAVHAAVFGAPGGRGSALREGIERLRHLHSAAPDSLFRAWIETRLGQYLVLSRRADEGLALAASACRTIVPFPDPRELEYRRRDYAGLLLQAGRPGEALELITFEPDDPPVRRAQVALERVRPLLALGHAAEAHDWLLRARGEMQAHGLRHLHAPAEELAGLF